MALQRFGTLLSSFLVTACLVVSGTAENNFSKRDNQGEKVRSFQRDIPSHTVAQVRRQIFVPGGKVQNLTAKQDCDGILLEWDRLHMPFSPNRRTANREFQHFNIYRNTVHFDNVSGMNPHVSGERDKSLQTSRTNSYKDLYPPVNTKLYYAVTVVNGEGQEEKDVDVRKVVFMGAMKKEGTLSNLVPEELSQLGKVLHHSAAFNPRRNEYLVAFDFDVDKDNVPDQLYAGRVDSSGQVVPDRVLNFTSDINGTAGNQGWPSVAYNNRVDEYLIIFQLRSGVMRYFSNEYVIVSQRVLSFRTKRAAAPILLTEAEDGARFIDARKPLLLNFNSVTGGYVAAVVVQFSHKRVASLFMDSGGKVIKVEGICEYKGDCYEPNIFFDSKRNEFYFTFTAEYDSNSRKVLVTKRNSSGAGYALSDTETIGFTNKTFARTSGYYNELTDRLILYWEDSDSGRNFLTTASVLLSREQFIWNTKPYSCMTTKRVRMPAAVYFPINYDHFLVWQEQDGNSWSIGGELLQGNLQRETGSEQKNPLILYNKKVQRAFVTWQEAGGVFSHHITMATRMLCSPPCSSQQTCAIQDTCVSNKTEFVVDPYVPSKKKTPSTKQAKGLTSKQIIILSTGGSLLLILLAALVVRLLLKRQRERNRIVPDEDAIAPYATVRARGIFAPHAEQSANGLPGMYDNLLEAIPFPETTSSEAIPPEEGPERQLQTPQNSPYENTDHLGRPSANPLEYLFFQPRYENEADNGTCNVLIKPGYDKLEHATRRKRRRNYAPFERSPYGAEDKSGMPVYDSIIQEIDLQYRNRREYLSDDSECDEDREIRRIMEVTFGDEHSQADTMHRTRNEDNLKELQSEVEDSNDAISLEWEDIDFGCTGIDWKTSGIP